MKSLDAQAILKTLHQPLLILDKSLIVTGANRAFYHRFEVDPDETVGVAIYDLGNGQWDIPKLRELLTDILPTSGSIDDFVVEHTFESIGRRIMKINARKVPEHDPDVILLAIDDITQQENLLSQLEWQKELAEKTIDASPVPFLVLGEDLRVKKANDTFYDAFKVDREETIGRLVFELGNNQWDIPRLRELLEDVLPANNTVDDFEVEHDFEQIGHRVMMLNARRIDHLQLILLAIDLTAHRVIERTQLEDAERRSFTLELLDRMREENDAKALVDVTCAALGHRLGADQVLYGEVGEGDEQFVPRVWSNGPRPEASQDVQIPFLVRLKAGQTVTIDDTQENTAVSSLVYVPLMEGGQLRAILGVHFFKPHDWRSVDVKLLEGVAERLRDAVARCHAEAELRVSQERFSLVTKATNDAIWDADLIVGTQWWNESLQSTFGYDPAQVEPGPASWHNRIHTEDNERVLESVNAVLAGSSNSWTEEYRFMHADGHPLTVIDRAFIIRDAEGKAVRITGSMSDVTAMRDTENLLRQSQKLEAMGQLTGGVAHDFNNLLTIILGSSELIAESTADPNLLELAAMAVSAANRGAALTHRLLAFARKQALKPVQLDINSVVRSVEGMLRRTLPESVELGLFPANDLWQVELDPNQFEVALLNLVINARDAMPNGGKLTIETANVWLDAAWSALNSDFAAGPYVQVTVTDNGTGMSPEIVERVFEPFFTTKPEGAGTGLGSSMVYGFVKQSGGYINIYSELGEGTAFKLYFPRIAPEQNGTETVTTDETMRVGHELILVVEDDDLVREHLVRQLQALGYQVVEAMDGRRGLEILAETPGIDLLLTDVVMPGGMNGLELSKEARKHLPGLKVLFTSGYSENVIAHNGMLDPGVELLSKPFRRQELAAKVRKVLDG